MCHPPVKPEGDTKEAEGDKENVSLPGSSGQSTMDDPDEPGHDTDEIIDPLWKMGKKKIEKIFICHRLKLIKIQEGLQMVHLSEKRNSFAYRLISAFVAFTFATSLIAPPALAASLSRGGVFNLPPVGTMVKASRVFVPAMIKGLTVDAENPLRFQFVIDTGDSKLEGTALKEESERMIRYFLASLTTPDNELWVNLSPYEKDRIIPEEFGRTELGMELLAQDYLLKQLTASLMYPEDDLGASFWKRVRAKAKKLFGTSEIPLNTFNKVWIVPDTAAVYQEGASAYVVENRLKVMLEEDFLALERSRDESAFGLDRVVEKDAQAVTGVSAEVVREVLIPEIEREVNEGETFANLRQIYNSVILANWYKQNLRESLLGQIYVDQNKTKGVDVDDPETKRKIYDQYVAAFKQGVYNYIKEDYDPVMQRSIPRKYFSGGGRYWKRIDQSDGRRNRNL